MKFKNILSTCITALALCAFTPSLIAADAPKKKETAPTQTKKAIIPMPLINAGEYTLSLVTDHPMQLALMNEKHGKWIITPEPGIIGIVKAADIKKCKAIVSIDTNRTAMISFHDANKKSLASYTEMRPMKIKPVAGTTADAATKVAAKQKPKTGV